MQYSLGEGVYEILSNFVNVRVIQVVPTAVTKNNLFFSLNQAHNAVTI